MEVVYGCEENDSEIYKSNVKKVRTTIIIVVISYEITVRDKVQYKNAYSRSRYTHYSY